jgi:hypothetical protein
MRVYVYSSHEPITRNSSINQSQSPPLGTRHQEAAGSVIRASTQLVLHRLRRRSARKSYQLVRLALHLEPFSNPFRCSRSRGRHVYEDGQHFDRSTRSCQDCGPGHAAKSGGPPPELGRESGRSVEVLPVSRSLDRKFRQLQRLRKTWLLGLVAARGGWYVEVLVPCEHDWGRERSRHGVSGVQRIGKVPGV